MKLSSKLFLDATDFQTERTSGIENVFSMLVQTGRFELVVWNQEKDKFLDKNQNPIPNGSILISTNVPKNVDRISSLLKLVESKAVRLKVLMHDMLPMANPWTFLDSAVLASTKYAYLCSKAEEIVFVSQESNHAFLNYIELSQIYFLDRQMPKLSTVTLPTPQIFESKYIDSISNEDCTILILGNFEPRKNILGALEAIRLASIQSKLDVILVGAYRWNIDLSKILKKYGTESMPIRYFENLSDADLELIWLSTDLLLYSSLGEGFGLPVSEALFRHIPAIASSHLPVSKMVADHPLFYESMSSAPEDLSNAIKLCLKNYKRGIESDVLLGKLLLEESWKEWAQACLIKFL